MELSNKIKELSTRINSLKENISTEEATKNAFILPFIQSLGYDIFNPKEVVPEFDSDITGKLGHKVDYAILQKDSPIMVIECKHWEENLDRHVGQLKKYFVACKARFGILTNGIEIRFFTDLVDKNKMDNDPFLIVNLLDLKDNTITELSKFTKSNFDEKKIIDTASTLKYTYTVKALFQSQLEEPSEDLIKLIGKRICPDRRINQNLINTLSPIIKKALNQSLKEIVNDRLQTALNTPEPEQLQEEVEDDGIVTTEEELQGFYIVKGIVSKYVESARVSYKDTKHYFRIMIDGKTANTLCILRFNTCNKYIAFIEDNKEVKFQIDSVENIYQHEANLIDIVKEIIQKESN